MQKFASLHNHSYFSLLDATLSPQDLVQQSYDLGFSAVAITEHGNMFSFIEGYKKAKELGIKFISGVEAYETSDMSYKESGSDRYHLILLAKSEIGLKNLFQIVSHSYIEGFYTKPRVDLNMLSQFSEGIICSSSCLGGRINRILGHKELPIDSDKFNEAQDWVMQYKKIFGNDFYLELQCHDTVEQVGASRNLLNLSKLTDTKLIITFDTHLKDGSELQRNAHALFIQTSQDRDENDFTSIVDTYEGCWQQSVDEIHTVMDKQIGYKEVEAAIKNTYFLSEKCNYEIPLHQNLMPHVSIPKDFQTENQYLRHLINEGFMKRKLNKLTKSERDKYIQRIREEIEVIEYLEFEGYFLMLYTLMAEMKRRKIPLNYGRGSAAGCLILYTLGVTEVDSLKWDLDFSRFANKGRKGSPADVDIDISKNRRQEAIEIAVELFGRENVAQVSTFNSFSPKVCVRDLSKALDAKGVYDIPYRERDTMSKLIPDDQYGHMTIERALEASANLRQYEKRFPLLFEYAKILQNLPKSVGCHASALLIAPTSILDYSPVMLNKKNNVMTHIEMHNAMDDIGLVKMDFLGLQTLDIVEDTLALSNQTWDNIDLTTINLNDINVMHKIYGEGKTYGIFQMESFIVQEMYKKMMPDLSIMDVFAVNAMNRPAILSVGMDNVYIKNKKNAENTKYLHPELEPIFRDTYGIMLYQEQALKVFALAGFSEEERDAARRAIGKKKKEVIEPLFEQFKNGLLSRNWNEETIKELWDLVEVQSSYSFNASHSYSYGLLSYVTAYLKYYYPIEFMTALLISETGKYDETTKCISECKAMGIKVLPPDINYSDRHYSIVNDSILFGLESIKGVGAKDVEKILDERKNSLYKDLHDFLDRTKLDSSSTVALIQSGAFGSDKDSLLMTYIRSQFDRKTFKPVKTLPTQKVLVELDIVRTEKDFKDKEMCLQRYNDHRLKTFQQDQENKFQKHIEEYAEKYMSLPEMYEYNTLSVFLTFNPFEGIEKDEKGQKYFRPLTEHEEGQKCLIGGAVAKLKFKKDKSGRRYCYLDLLTEYGIVECAIFAETYSRYQTLCAKGTNIVALAKKSGEQYIVSEIKPLKQWKQEKGIAK